MQFGNHEQREKFAKKLEHFYTRTLPQDNFEKPLDLDSLPKKDQQLIDTFINFGEKSLKDPAQQDAWANFVNQLKKALSEVPVTSKDTSGTYALATKAIISQIFVDTDFNDFIKRVLEQIGQSQSSPDEQPQSPPNEPPSSSPEQSANQEPPSQPPEAAKPQLDAKKAHKAYQLLKRLTVNFGNDLRKLRVGDQTCKFQIEVKFNFDFLGGVERGNFLSIHDVSLLNHKKALPLEALVPANSENLTLLGELSKLFSFNLNGPHHLDSFGRYSVLFNCAADLTEDDQFLLSSMTIKPAAQ